MVMALLKTVRSVTVVISLTRLAKKTSVALAGLTKEKTPKAVN